MKGLIYFILLIEGGLPVGSRYKPGHQPGLPTGRYTGAGQNTGEEEKKIQLVEGNVVERQVAEESDEGGRQFKTK